MNVVLKTAAEREEWAAAEESRLLLGGASFSEWATLMSYEAHNCFVAGADIATIILCASCVESYLRTELDDHNSKLVQLIDSYGFDETLRKDVHKLRLARNQWAHSTKEITATELRSFEMAYTPELETSAMHAYRTMLRVLFSGPCV